MIYGNVYVAQVAMGANDAQCVRAFLEAEAFDGPSLIIAYSHCIAHGINMTTGMQNQRVAVETGYWPLFRYNPMLSLENKSPFKLDSKAPKSPVGDFMKMETRFNMLSKSYPQRAKELEKLAAEDVSLRWEMLEQIAKAAEEKYKAVQTSTAK
jgi:pyruvate-ferredoxin/flavodoxin oxidoreductase